MRQYKRNIIFIFLLVIAVPMMTACAAVFSALEVPSTSAEAIVIGDAERGADIFKVGINGSPPCSSCHQSSTNSYSLGIGPSMIGISERAGMRVEGLSAEEYLRNSILEPDSFVVSGFSVEMYSDYREHFSEQDIADLIAFLMEL